MIDEGYIKFNCVHTPMEWEAPELASHLNHANLAERLAELDVLRTDLHDVGFVGMYESGIGFGNISLRLKSEPVGEPVNESVADSADVNGVDSVENKYFIISATATGGARELGRDGYCLVTKSSKEENKVWSMGPLQASSETLTHAAIYEASPQVQYIVHIHHKQLFSALLQEKQSLKTPKNVAYGTVEMALALQDVVKSSPLEGCVVMQGHDEGIIFYATSIEQIRSLIRFVSEHLLS